MRAHKALFHIFQFGYNGYNEGYCSTYHASSLSVWSWINHREQCSSVKGKIRSYLDQSLSLCHFGIFLDVFHEIDIAHDLLWTVLYRFCILNDRPAIICVLGRARTTFTFARYKKLSLSNPFSHRSGNATSWLDHCPPRPPQRTLGPRPTALLSLCLSFARAPLSLLFSLYISLRLSM